MKNELGSYDLTKQQRIAIAVRCIGRSGMKFEKELFKKHFPEVPAFTFLSYGECGYHTILGKFLFIREPSQITIYVYKVDKVRVNKVSKFCLQKLSICEI